MYAKLYNTLPTFKTAAILDAAIKGMLQFALQLVAR